MKFYYINIEIISNLRLIKNWIKYDPNLEDN